MKGIFTLLFALTLSVAVNAQTKILKPDTSLSSLENSPQLSLITPSAKQSDAPRRKIQVDEGEHIMGYYDTDELSDDALYFLSNGAFDVGNLFSGDVLTKFVGGQIVRFRFELCQSAKVYCAYIYSVNSSNYLSSEPLAYVSLGEDGAGETLPAGWNDIELDEPVTIEEGYSYLICYEYEQVSNVAPIAVDYPIEQDFECNYFYYFDNYYYYSWVPQSGYGALCIQAVVKGGNFPEDDITLKNLSAEKFAPKGTDLAYSFNIRSSGNKIPSSYELKVTLDGSELETLSDPITLTGNYQTIEKTLSTDNLDYGSHTLSVEVVSINGAAPTEYTSDDLLEASFIIYNENETVERQKHVIEHFTSIYCGYCPLGIETLQTLVNRNPDKYAWVSLHGYGQGEDPYCLFPGYYYSIEYFSGASSIGYPVAAFSRALLTSANLGVSKQMALSIGYSSSSQSSIAQCIDEAVDEAYEGIPAFVSVDITPDYDADTRKLTITVSGEGASNAKQILENNRLTIYVTENGIEGTQEDYNNGSYRNGYFVDFTHDHVLRAIANDYEWGDDISWKSDSSYENTVTTTLDSSWDDSQIYITAFISGPMAVLQSGTWYYGNVADAMVNNANCVKATDVPAGISAVTVNTDDVTHTYYTTDGRLLSTPVKGVNILKSSDGTVKKVYVK